MTKRFLLLTVPKSGSNYFGSRISELPHVTYLNTLFSKGFFATHFNMHNLGPKSKAGVLSELFNLILSDEKVVNELIRVRTERAPVWLMSVMQMDPGGYLGAKIHPYLDIWYPEKDNATGEIQTKFALDPEIITNFFAPKYHWKIITMARKDYYQQMASSFLSMKTEYFSQEDQPEEPLLFREGKVSNEEIEKYRGILAVYKMCYQYIEKLRKKEEVTHIWYENLIKNDIPKEVIEYFSVRKLPEVQNEKLFKREYADAFDDYNYFKKLIDEL